MRITRTTRAFHCIVLVAAVSGCEGKAEIPEAHDAAAPSAYRGEHTGNVGQSRGERSGEHGEERSSEHGEDGEESGTEYTLDRTFDSIRNGVRLRLSFDTQTYSFIGTVENTIERTLERVRVEVHLSNGIELGPTTPVDLKPGEKSAVKLTTSSGDFETWSAHPEVGRGEHGR